MTSPLNIFVNIRENLEAKNRVTTICHITLASLVMILMSLRMIKHRSVSGQK